MSESATCASCGKSVKAAAKFCSHCGATRQPAAPPIPPAPPQATAPAPAPRVLACPECGARLPAGATGRWECAYCRAAVDLPSPGEGPRAASAASDAGGASVAPGTANGARAQRDGARDAEVADWPRAADEVVRRVGASELLAGLRSKQMRVPPGSYAAVLGDGGVKEVLGPGAVVSASWWERLQGLFAGALDRGEVVLLDARPVPAPFSAEYRRADGQAVQLDVVVELVLPREDRAALGRFLEQVLGAQGAVTGRTLHGLVRPHLAAQLEGWTKRWAQGQEQDLDAARARLEAALAADLGARYGLGARVLLTEQGRSFVVEQSLGAAPDAGASRACPKCAAAVAPGKGFCKQCGAEVSVGAAAEPAKSACGTCATPLKPGARFCGRCGTASPAAAGVASAPLPAAGAAPLVTKDGRAVQVDVVVTGRADDAAAAAARVKAALGPALARVLRGHDFAALAAPAGFAAAEAEAGAALAQALAAFGVAGAALTLVDVREPGSEWLLGARASLDRALQEVTLGREWLAADEQARQLRAAALDLALRVQETEREFAFSRRRAALAARQREQALRDEEAALDVADARRDARRTVDQEAAARDVTRARAEGAHEDRMQARAHHGAEARAEREEEAARGDHRDAQARQGMKLDSDRTRLRADDASYVERATRDVAFDDAKRQQELKLAKMAAMVDLDQRVAQSDHEREQAARQQANDHAARMRQQLAGLSAEQMLAMQIGDGANAEAIATALTGVSDASRERARHEAVLAAHAAARADADAKVEAERERAQARLDAQGAQMMAVVQQVLASQQAVTVAAVTGQAPKAKVAAGCVRCGAAVDGVFCDACGARQG